MHGRTKAPAVSDVMSFGVLVLSVALIIWLSIDMTDGVDLVADHNYITFQFWVCIFFMTDFFVELAYSDNKGRYFLRRLIFLLLSIPYINIFQTCQVPMSHEVLCFLRFAPIARGALALALVMGYLSKNALTSMFISYLAIMVLVGYFCSLIFYEQETIVNPQVRSYWSAMYWAAMNMTTVGCDIQPLTVAGKIVSVIVPVCGMIVFPLFTVYLSDYVTRMVKKVRES